MFWDNLKKGMACRCPRCGQGKIFSGVLELVDECSECHLKIAENDNGDGPAVLLIFLLGFSLVPLALWVDWYYMPPVWVHTVLWSVLGVACTIGMLRPAKAYVLALEYHHRPDRWNKD